MSSASPPYPWFSGITYNPSFFPSSSSTGDLTKAQANTLYLQKTIPDTATAIEKFQVGIKTPSVDSLTSSTVLNIGANSGAINISKPMTVSYSPSAYTNSFQIGYKLPGTSAGATTTTGSAYLKLWEVTLPPGTWMMLGGINFTNPGLNGYYYLSISSAINIDNNFGVSNVYTTNNSYLAQVSRIEQVNTNTTLYLVAQTGITCPVNAITFNVYRIA
jgi:hypothetical protein